MSGFVPWRGCARRRSQLDARSASAAVGLLLFGTRASAQSERATEIRRQVAAILDSPEYARASRDGAWLRDVGEHVRQALSAVGEALDRWLSFGGSLDPGHAHALTCTVIGVLAALLAYAAWRAAAALHGRALARRADGSKRRADGPGRRSPPITPEDMLRSARDKAALGDWPAAYRLAFACLLRALHGAAVISYDPTRTNGEYRRDLASNAVHAPWFIPLSSEYDRLVYGRNEIARAETERCLAACERAISLAPSGDRAPSKITRS